MDTLGLNYSIMTHVPDEDGPVSRHIVMDDADIRPGPTRLSLPLMLSLDGFWCMFTQYAPRVPLCPECRQWLRDRHRSKVAALNIAREVTGLEPVKEWYEEPPTASFYEIASG